MNRFLAFLAALILGVFLVLGVLVFSYRDFFLKIAVEFLITETTGFRTEIKTLQHEWPANFTLRGVKMYNPGGYTKPLFAISPYFYIELDLNDIMKNNVFHIRAWRLIIRELHLEKSKEGVTNGAMLKSIKNIFRGKDNSSGGSGSSFLMDRLDVQIQKITYRDRTGVLRKKISTGLFLPASTYENVTDFKGMIYQIKDKVLEVAGPGKVVMLSPFVLENSLKKAADRAKETTAAVTKAPLKVMESAEKAPVVAKTGEILKTTAQGVTEATREQWEKIIGKPSSESSPAPLSEIPLKPAASPQPAS